MSDLKKIEDTIKGNVKHHILAIFAKNSCTRTFLFYSKLNPILFYSSLLFRAFLKSKWCKYEFSHAYDMVLEGKPDYIVVVLLDDVPQKTLSEELKAYLKTYTYIDARQYGKDIELIRKRIRFALPKVPLEQLKVIMLA